MDFPPEGEEGEIPEHITDCLDDLDEFSCLQPDLDTYKDNSDYLKLSGHFHGEEDKGEPLYEHLATIHNTSLRCQPTSGGVKITCSEIKFPSNIPNMSELSTNTAVAKAMSVGGRLIDVQLAHTKGLTTKAPVPIAECIMLLERQKATPSTVTYQG